MAVEVVGLLHIQCAHHHAIAARDRDLACRNLADLVGYGGIHLVTDRHDSEQRVIRTGPELDRRAHNLVGWAISAFHARLRRAMGAEHLSLNGH